MKLIPRTITLQLTNTINYFPAVLLTGARQVGKTTLLQEIFPGYSYVTLDRPLNAEQAEHDPEGFLRQHPTPLIVDEVQYAPNLFRFLKIVIDQDRNMMGRFILTGSQKFNLMKGVVESLAGRIAVLELEGLSCQELKDASKVTWSNDGITDLIIRGGFPELWAHQEKNVRMFIDYYISTYLERDVRQIHAVGNLRDFERFLRACAHRSGQQLNKSDIARDVGVSVPTVSEWLSVLSALGHIVLLEPWFGNLTKRLVKAPKLYIADTGILCALCGITPETLWSSPHIGAIWETFVFAELRKQLAASGKPRNLWFYRDQNNHEVDFILEDAHNLSLYECKWTSTPTTSLASSLKKVQKIFTDQAGSKVRIVRCALISRSQDELSVADIDYCSPWNGLLSV
jgi:predicted AAA+ superfamily ATPase